MSMEILKLIDEMSLTTEQCFNVLIKKCDTCMAISIVSIIISIVSLGIVFKLYINEKD